MKNAKKIIGLLLVLAMAISMSSLAFAEPAETGSITVENPLPEAGLEGSKDAEYKAYKIFDVVYNETTGTPDKYAYTISTGSPWYDVVAAWATEEHGLTLTKSASDDTKYMVTVSDTFDEENAGDFAAYLSGEMEANRVAAGSYAITLIKTAEGKMVATDLELGYYFVTTTSGSTCHLTTTNPDVVIHDKNKLQTIDKSFTTDYNGDGKSDPVDLDGIVEVGETVTFTLKSEVPSVEGYKYYEYTITDSMSENLTLIEDSLTLSAAGETLTAEQLVAAGLLEFGGASTDPEVEDFDFQIKMDLVEILSSEYEHLKPGQEIIVTYQALVNKEALVNGVLTNVAKLSTHTNLGDTENEDPETLHVADIIIDKYDAANKETKLEGATFVLYKEVEGAKKYYKFDAAANEGKGAVTWVDTKEAADKVTTDDKGATSFKGLGTGTYFLQEIEAPKGYNLLDEDIEVVIDKDTILSTGSNDNNTITADFYVEVANNAGSLLPSTGGIGTAIFYILGTVLVAGAFILIVTRRRASAEK